MLSFCIVAKEDLGIGRIKDICMYWFAGLISSEWLTDLTSLRTLLLKLESAFQIVQGLLNFLLNSSFSPYNKSANTVN